MKLTLDLEFNLKDTVYLKTDSEQLARFVTSISLKGSGAILYGLTCGTTDSDHYDFEISAEKDILKCLDINSQTQEK